MFRNVQISAVLNGWVVTVGCQTVVYQDRNQLVTDLDAYLKDPDTTEQRFLKTGVNGAHTGGLGQLATTGSNQGMIANEASAPPSRDQLRQMIRAQEAQARHDEMAKMAVERERG